MNGVEVIIPKPHGETVEGPVQELTCAFANLRNACRPGSPWYPWWWETRESCSTWPAPIMMALVLVAFGSGNVPPGAVPAIGRWIEEEKPVVLASGAPWAR